MLGSADWPLRAAERLIVVNQALLDGRYLVVGITRVRNESLILQDTLDHVGRFADAIVAYDDASTDATRAILENHPRVALVIENDRWESGSQARLAAETRHRSLLLAVVRRRLRSAWIYCFDADERIEGDLRDYLENVTTAECNGVRVQLFDAYLTPEDQAPVMRGERLLDRRRFFGPERRDILMLWRNLPQVQFRGLDAREPVGVNRIVTHFRCQHYGKAISVDQWEATCDYYTAHFPHDTYGRKWLERKGRAIHIVSDFGRPLCAWGPPLFAAATPVTEARGDAGHSASGSLVVLLATNYLSGWTGSETLLLTLVEGLREQGCALVVYARHLDRSWAARQIGDDVLFTDDIDTLCLRRFDLAHVQHSSCVIDVRAAFPQLPIIFSSLGVLPFLEQPPPFACGIARHLAISEEVRNNLVARGVPGAEIELVRNLVSERRFVPTAPIRARPERILVLSNKMDASKKVTLQAAARLIGASIRFVGGAGETLSQDQLATAINAADAVVSLGRGVVEAMLCGRVPLVFDIHGGDGLVTPDNLNELRACNFSGRFHRHKYAVSDLVHELGQYRSEYGNLLREQSIKQFGLKANLPRLLDIYARVAATEAVLPESLKQTIIFTSLLAREDLRQSQLQQMKAQEVQRLEAQIARIKSTVSWQITKPLRFLAFIWRKLFHADKLADSQPPS